jgi:uncharacterized protein
MLMPDLNLCREFVALNPPSGRVVLCAVSGAHMYGFPSPDSDLDIKGIHLVATEELLGLRPNIAVHDLTSVHRNVECDLTTNEAGSALALLLNGNGNMLERILSPFQLIDSAEILELQELARRSISRAFIKHYAGFFRGCQREHEREPTAKAMLYSYRVALTGAYLLRTGRFEPDVTVLAPAFGFHEVAELVALKQTGTEHGPMSADLDEHHRRRWPTLEQLLIDAEVASTLPMEAPNAAQINAWLVAARLAALPANRGAIPRR